MTIAELMESVEAIVAQGAPLDSHIHITHDINSFKGTKIYIEDFVDVPTENGPRLAISITRNRKRFLDGRKTQ